MVDPTSVRSVQENLLYIRKTLEAAGQITAVPGRCLIAVGFIAFAGAAVNALLTGAPWVRVPIPYGACYLGGGSGCFAGSDFRRHLSKKPPDLHPHPAPVAAQAAVEPLSGAFCGRALNKSGGPVSEAGMASRHMAGMLWRGHYQWRTGVRGGCPVQGGLVSCCSGRGSLIAG